MLALLISLWTISIILLVADPKTESTRWLAAISFFSGLGGLAIVIRANIIPYFQAKITQDIRAIDNLMLAYDISTSLAHYIAPYTLLIYGICYSDLIRDYWNRKKLIIIGFLLLPPVAMFILFPIRPFLTSYPVLSIWVTPYVLGANFMLVYSFIRTKEPKMKQQRLLTCVIITPGTLMSLATNFLLRAFNINDAFYYNVFIIVLQFVAFIFFAIKQGALGVKVTLEKNSMDRTMRALTSGTAILNHTIKNEVLKISICMNNIEHSIIKNNEKREKISAPKYSEAGNPDDEHAYELDNNVISDVHENVSIVNDSTNYLVLMINKIQNHVKDIILDESEILVGSVIDKAVNMVSLFARNKNIALSPKHGYEYLMIGDGLHLQETLINILKNSIESIESNGAITIDVIKKNKVLSILIKDNGSGISKENLTRVIDPFFSTKHRSGNFGLGLSYCYSVMQHHGGSLEVESEEGKGTTVTLNFPAKRVVMQSDLGLKIQRGS